jgi:DNA topoisomerase III
VSYTVTIAEKHSVAKELAYVLGANTFKQGYFEGNGHLVSYAVGHLLELAKPDVYDQKYKAWTIEDLPIIPDVFKLIVVPDTKAQFNVCKTLLNRDDVTSVICATDAGREGELIFRQLYLGSGCKKPFKRLWISSLTEESILKGMENLKDSREYDNLFASAYARAKADWIFGINFTRLFSVKHNNKLTAGRVQTPTLNMIVKRDLEIENFVKEKYYTLKLDNGAVWFKDDASSMKNLTDAEKIKAKCTGKTATVTDVVIEKKTENRPLLYSLNSLQQEASKKLKFSAQKTLTVMQSLYEAKLATYPRTDSNHLTDDMKGTAKATITILAEFYKPDMVKAVLNNGLVMDERNFDDSQVSDHHAIIPTEDIANMQKVDLSKDQRDLLEMIIDRFIISFSEPHVYELSSFVFSVQGETFKVHSRKVIQEGFKRLLPDSSGTKDKEKDSFVTGLSFQMNDTFKVKSIDIKECFTKPKEHYTDGTMIAAMEHIAREIEDEELKGFVKKGLGTPATRASIIEKLIDSQYVERKGVHLISTSLGRKFIEGIPLDVKDIAVTADWEQVLLDIEHGKAKEKDFLNVIIESVNTVVTLESLNESERIVADKEIIGVCPRCGKNIFVGEKAFYCEGIKDEPKCGFSLHKADKFFSEKGKEITKDMAKKLLSAGKVFIKGLKKHEGEGTYDAFAVLQDTGTFINFKLDFEKGEQESIGKCPRCGKFVFENVKAFSCEGYKDDPKCSFAVWKNDKFLTGKGIKPTKSVVSKLITGKKILVKGMKNKDGTGTFDGYIQMEDTGKFVNFKVAEYVK